MSNNFSFNKAHTTIIGIWDIDVAGGTSMLSQKATGFTMERDYNFTTNKIRVSSTNYSYTQDFSGSNIFVMDIRSTLGFVVKAYVNGVLETTSPTIQNSLGQFTFRIMSNAANNNFMKGAFAEAVIIPDNSTEIRQKAEGYLAWKWGLQGKLPPGHPYENAAPEIFTVSYTGNGSDGGSAPSDQTVDYNTGITLATNTFTKTGYTFNGWSCGAA